MVGVTSGNTSLHKLRAAINYQARASILELGLAYDHALCSECDTGDRQP
jgi:hypothetical protein